MAQEFSIFVDKILDVIDDKKTDLGCEKFYPFDPPILLDLPAIGVVFDRCVPERMNEAQARYELHANIWYHFAKFDAGLQAQALNDRVAFLAQWLMKNQTLKGFALANWVSEISLPDGGVEKGNVLIASAVLHLIAYKDKVDIKSVD